MPLPETVDSNQGREVDFQINILPHGPNHQKPTSATLGTFKGGTSQGQLVGRATRLAESRELSRSRTFLLR